MTSHGWNDERTGSQPFEIIGNTLDDQGNIVDSPASASDCNRVALLDTGGKVQLGDFLRYLRRNIKDTGRVKLLLHAQHLWKTHFGRSIEKDMLSLQDPAVRDSTLAVSAQYITNCSKQAVSQRHIRPHEIDFPKEEAFIRTQQ